MSVYRRKLRGQKSKVYTIDFTFHGTHHRYSSGLQTRKLAEAREREDRLKLEQGCVNVAERYTASKAAPILPIIEEYVEHLKTLGRDSMYCYTTSKRLHRLCVEAHWTGLGAISLNGFNAWRAMAQKTPWRGKLPKPKTLNQFLDSLRAFCGWCVKPKGYLPSNPVLDAEKANVIDNPDYRRAATVKEIEKLLDAASPVRRLAYLFALYVPAMRRDALEHLRWGDVVIPHPDDGEPRVTVRAEHNKSRKHEQHFIPRELADTLVKFRSAKPTDLVFPDFPTIDQIKADLDAAGVPFDDGHGNRRLDLHAFRKTATAWMEESGVSLSEASRALGHRHVSTTEKHYRDPTRVKRTGMGKVKWVGEKKGGGK